MSPFRRVEGSQAGPSALGILLPPGRRTVVVVRPRGLDWDLLPLNPNENGGPRFWEAARIEAQDVAQRLYRALEANSAEGGVPRRCRRGERRLRSARRGGFLRPARLRPSSGSPV